MPVDVTPFRKNWAKGKRLEFLNDHIPLHRAQRRLGKSHGVEYAHKVVNEFVDKFTWWLPMEKDPDPLLTHDESSLSEEDLGVKRAALDRLTKGIENFFETRWSAADSITRMTKAEIAKNPLSAFLAKITNTKLHGQRRRGCTPYQMWSKEEFSTVRENVDGEVERQSLNARKERIAKAQGHTIAAFNALPADQRKHWEKRAEEDKKEVAAMKEGASAPLEALDPLETQKVLDGLGATLQEFLEGFALLTGGNVSFIWAGPEPTKGGQINVISVHAGSNNDTVPKTFDLAAGDRGKRRRKLVEAAFGEFAMECFSIDDQEKRALEGTDMPINAPSFMRQVKPWNNPAPHPGIPALNSLPSAVAPPATAGKHRRDDVEPPTRKPKRRRTSQKTPTSDSEESEASPPPSPSPAPGDDVAVPTRKSKRQRTSRKASTPPPDNDESEASPPPSPPSAPSRPVSPSPPSPPLEVVKPLPAWLQEAKDRLLRFNVPVSFAKLVDLWVDLELQQNNVSADPPAFLPATKRPLWVTYWIARARSKEDDLKGRKPKTLAKDFWAWWIAIQPAWRNLKLSDAPILPDHRPKDVGEDETWGALDTRGINGFLSVMMALGWWGEVAMVSMMDLSEWSYAELDVKWVISRLSG